MWAWRNAFACAGFYRNARVGECRRCTTWLYKISREWLTRARLSHARVLWGVKRNSNRYSQLFYSGMIRLSA
jgi:hypothetical protein